MCKSLRYNKHGRSPSESVFMAELLYNIFLGGITKLDARETKKACHSPGKEHFSCLNGSKWFLKIFPCLSASFMAVLLPRPCQQTRQQLGPSGKIRGLQPLMLSHV